ncbi:MAG TPA: hypothetical protein VIG51_08425 [Candidatus Baltobacteraceae bacterium]|jgi:hypothetical protein
MRIFEIDANQNDCPVGYTAYILRGGDWVYYGLVDEVRTPSRPPWEARIIMIRVALAAIAVLSSEHL